MFDYRIKCLKTAFSLCGRTTFFLSLFIFLSGCSVGPRYVKPEISVNQTWSVPDTTPLLVTRSQPDSAWWTIFGDPVLDSLVRLASQQNLTLQIAGLKITEARAQLAATVGKQYPQVQAAIGNVTAIGASKDISEALGINRNFLNYQVGFDVSWEADFWGKYRSEVKAQKSTLLGTEADFDNALVSLIAEVARTYTSIRTYQVLISLARRHVQLQSDGLEIAKSRFKNGASPELDVIQATTLLESTKASIPQLELSLIQSGNALSTLLGLPPETNQKLLQDSGCIPPAPSEVAIVLPAQLLQRRPDVLRAQLLAEAQCSRIGIAKSELYPKILLSGKIRTQSSSDLGLPTSNLFTPGSFFYALGPQLVWPILNYGRFNNKIRAEDARFQQLLTEYENTVLKAINEVEDWLSGYLKSREAAVFAQNAACEAQRSVSLSLDLYREGAVDYQRVLEAQRSLLQEENTLAQANSTIITNLISLYKALGGGWELRSGISVVKDSTRVEMQHRTNWGNLISRPETPDNNDIYTPEHR
ncbi:MAG TPA: efflux transporter outer membrane subunit [Chitinispirillaceae bacterium]|nr:efflux transporter outer membrane subunit [Chitinispirillaceae bacterium]